MELWVGKMVRRLPQSYAKFDVNFTASRVEMDLLRGYANALKDSDSKDRREFGYYLHGRLMASKER